MLSNEDKKDVKRSFGGVVANKIKKATDDKFTPWRIIKGDKDDKAYRKDQGKAKGMMVRHQNKVAVEKALKKVKEYVPKWGRKGYLDDPYGPKGEKYGHK